MFSECYSLKSVDVFGWDTSNVTEMNFIFNNCMNLTYVDVSGWDTSKVTNMYGMFSNCMSLKSIDISNWDVSNVTNFGSMFNSCASLKSVIGGKDVSEVSPDPNKGPRYDFQIRFVPHLDRESLLFIMEWLADLTGQTQRTLSMYNGHKNLLTESELDIARDKNWNLTFGGL